MKVKIYSNSRSLIVGRSGSGKTTFATKFLWNYLYKSVNKVFIDPKAELEGKIECSAVIENSLKIENYIKDEEYSILYIPETLAIEDFDTLCEIIYNNGNTTLFIDESAYFCDSHSISRWYKKLMIMGRSRGIGVINITQRPHGINQVLISESEHLFIFTLNLKRDIDKLLSMIPRDYHQRVEGVKQYHFFYANLRDNKYCLCKPIKLRY